MEESTSEIVEIKGTDSETLAAIIHYIYTAEIQITTANVQNLIQACEQLQFEGLKNACESFMHQQIEPTNCIGFYKFSKLFNLRLLQTGARSVMLTKLKEVVMSGEYKQLTVDDIIEYISDDNLKVSNEDTVFEAVVIWVKEDESSRLSLFPCIMEHVRLPYCTSTYLCHVVKESPYMTDKTCLDYLEEAQLFHMLPDHRHEICSTRTRPRRSFYVERRLVIVGGLNKEDKENRYCWYLKEESNSWELLAQLPRPNWKFYSVCVTQNGILVTGGYHGNVKKDCWLFDTSEKKWKTISAMEDARCKHKSVVHAGTVYVVGGEDDIDRPLKTIEKLDIRARHWAPATAMMKALSDPLVISHGKFVYVLGGIAHDDTTSTTTQVFDPVWGDWKYRSDMPHPCRLGAAAALNDKIYVVGGYTKSCMSYDPRLDVWTALTVPKDKHGNAPAVVWQGRILVGGGDLHSNETSALVEAYDADSDCWSMWPIALKEKLSCHYLINVDLFGI